jgi:crotonobetainyl-CoA:carnitine CoA-transferase CaiB-like acyl-CoA transferase
MRLGEIEHAERGASKPLHGVRILSLEQMQALPYATQLLAHLGADVVKVEPPKTGDSGRGASPAITDRDGRRVGATYLRNNLSKRSIAIDLKSADGRALVERLVPRFDVVCENFTPGTVARLGVDYESLRRHRSDLIYCSISGFGQQGTSPYADFPAYAPVVEAMSGLYEPTRRDGEPPDTVVAGALGDNAAALFGAIGILAALRHRDQTGQGQQVDIAMYDSMIALSDMVPFLASMDAPARWATSGSLGIVKGFRAKDGYFVIAVFRRHHFERLARILEQPEWLEDPKLATLEDWARETESTIRPALESWAADKSKHEAATLLAREGIAAGASQTAEDLQADAHVATRNMLIEVDRPDADKPIQIVGNPVKLSGISEGPVRRFPMLGEQTADVLREELALSDEEIERLAERGVIELGGARSDPS